MIHSFLMIGQSNMAGRGFLNEVKPIRDNRIFMLRNGRWQTMSEPIHFDRPFAGIGMGASFATRWLQDHPEDTIGLIPCADGGSSLDEWAPGEALFENAVNNVRLAQKISVLDGILWHQGENDCTEELIRTYPNRLEVFIDFLRETIGTKDIPFLIGALGDYLVECRLYNDFTKAPYMNRVLKEFARMHENCYFVSAAGLECNPDQLHLNAKSQRKFGLRYYEAFKSRKDISGPVPGESEIEAVTAGYVGMTMEEKTGLLKSDLRNGLLTEQEYEMRMKDLVREM